MLTHRGRFLSGDSLIRICGAIAEPAGGRLTGGPGGYWTTFEWDSAFRLGSKASDIPYSGKYGFAPTEMWWPLSHMVAPKEKALACTDCHGEKSRMDWAALGYAADPIKTGGRP